MILKINGKEREYDSEKMTVSQLLSLIEIKGPMVAVELNREVVKKQHYDETYVKDGDTVEVLHLVGGG